MRLRKDAEKQLAGVGAEVGAGAGAHLVNVDDADGVVINPSYADCWEGLIGVGSSARGGGEGRHRARAVSQRLPPLAAGGTPGTAARASAAVPTHPEAPAARTSSRPATAKAVLLKSWLVPPSKLWPDTGTMTAAAAEGRRLVQCKLAG